MNKVNEFLLWANCTNQCKFCWQCKKNDPETHLNKEEMVQCIDETIKRIEKIDNGDDVLLVGGEILAHYYDHVDNKLEDLFELCNRKVMDKQIRYLYINTNLLYYNLVNVQALLNLFNRPHLMKQIKFTTSYDVYGRFDDEKEKIFIRNLEFLNDHYKDLNIVINCIITKQLINFDLEKIFKLKEKYPVVKYINFIPYVPVEDDRSMDITFRDIVKVLAKLSIKYPGYIKHYIDDLDLNQNKILYEYRKSQGYVECTAAYADCHHNENFKKVLNGECYICKLKELFT